MDSFLQKHVTRILIVTLVLFGNSFVDPTARAAIIVEFDTNFGAFDVELFDAQTPVSVANFLSYANGGAYDNTIIHRSINNFVIQGGGYGPTGAPITTFGPIVDEIGISNLRGTLAYANTGTQNSAVNQWYFNLVDNLFLDTQFTVFGRVLGSGMNIVDQINALPTFNLNAPTNPLGPFTDVPVVNGNSLVVVNSIVALPGSSTAVPEPGSMLLLVVGLATSACRVRNRSRLGA